MTQTTTVPYLSAQWVALERSGWRTQEVLSDYTAVMVRVLC